MCVCEQVVLVNMSYVISCNSKTLVPTSGDCVWLIEDIFWHCVSRNLFDHFNKTALTYCWLVQNNPVTYASNWHDIGLRSFLVSESLGFVFIICKAHNH